MVEEANTYYKVSYSHASRASTFETFDDLESAVKFYDQMEADSWAVPYFLESMERITTYRVDRHDR